jgi:hypothetical protein
MDIHEVVRLLRDGASDREIRSLVGLNRRTVARYRRWAAEQNLLAGPLPDVSALETQLRATLPAVLPPQQVSTVAVYRDEVVALRQQGVEVAAIRVRLEEAHGQPLSYSALWRLVRRLEGGQGPEPFVRVEVPPGQEAQVDFGYAGRTLDPGTGQLRKTWVFVLVLAYSRHTYAELVFDQRVETLRLRSGQALAVVPPPRLRVPGRGAGAGRAGQPQGRDPARQRARPGRPARLPRVRPALRLPDRSQPAAVASPEGLVRAGRGPLRQAQLPGRAGARGDRRAEPEAAALVHRCGGTARPWDHQAAPAGAARAGRPAALANRPVDLATWKQATLHRDCHVVFEGSYYSAPYRLVGQRLWLRGGSRTVELFTSDHQRVATHDRAGRPGERLTVLAHLPPHSCRAWSSIARPAGPKPPASGRPRRS